MAKLINDRYKDGQLKSNYLNWKNIQLFNFPPSKFKNVKKSMVIAIENTI